MKMTSGGMQDLGRTRSVMEEVLLGRLRLMRGPLKATTLHMISRMGYSPRPTCVRARLSRTELLTAVDGPKPAAQPPAKETLDEMKARLRAAALLRRGL